MGSNQYWLWANRVGLFFVFATIVCYLWTWLFVSNAVLLQLYHQIMQLSVLGWTGFNWSSILLSLIQVYIWGYVGVALWSLTLSVTKK